eukprot:jgi/Tetstr1/454137/TSEL_041056.t1
MDSVPVMVLVLVLVTAVVAALIAFVLLPSMMDSRSAGEDMAELTVVDYVDDINTVNRAGYMYDRSQDQRIQAIENSMRAADDESPAEGGFLDTAASAFKGVLDNLEISMPSEEGGVPTVSLGPFSAPTNLTEVCYNDFCMPLGRGGNAPPGDDNDAGQQEAFEGWSGEGAVKMFALDA